MTKPQSTTATEGVMLQPPPRRLIRVFVRIDGKVKADYQEKER